MIGRRGQMRVHFRFLGTHLCPVMGDINRNGHKNICSREDEQDGEEIQSLFPCTEMEMNDSPYELKPDTKRTVNRPKRESLTKIKGLCRQGDIYKPLKDCHGQARLDFLGHKPQSQTKNYWFCNKFMLTYVITVFI